LNCVTKEKDVLEFIVIDTPSGARALKATLNGNEVSVEADGGEKIAGYAYDKIEGRPITFYQSEILSAARITLHANVDLTQKVIPAVKASVAIFDYDGSCLAPEKVRKLGAVCTVDGAG